MSYKKTLPSRLVIDANILFSFFKKDSMRRHIVEELLNKECKLISPRFVLKELRSEKEKIIKFSKISLGEFEFVFSLLQNEVQLKENYSEFLEKAKEISPHKNTKDVPYFALALSLDSPIWSDESEFKQQSEVEIISTLDLIEILNL